MRIKSSHAGRLPTNASHISVPQRGRAAGRSNLPPVVPHSPARRQRAGLLQPQLRSIPRSPRHRALRGWLQGPPPGRQGPCVPVRRPSNLPPGAAVCLASRHLSPCRPPHPQKSREKHRGRTCRLGRSSLPPQWSAPRLPPSTLHVSRPANLSASAPRRLCSLSRSRCRAP